MHKWQAKFAWQMIAFAVVLFFMAGSMLWEAWFFRAKLIAHPERHLFPTVVLIVGAVAVFRAAIMCINMSFSTRRHAAKMKELERNRPPLTLEGLREELRPEKQEQARAGIAKLLQSSSPNNMMSVENIAYGMDALVERYRKKLGSSPEVETELARLKAFNESLLEELKANS